MQQPSAIPNVAPPVVLIVTDPAEQREKCAWCWPVRHPGQPYPAAWSSTICPDHQAAMLAAHARIKATRATSARKG